MPAPTSFDHAVGKRVLISSQFTDPVTVEGIDIYGPIAALRVRTPAGDLKDATVEVSELEHLLAAAEDAGTGCVDPEHLFLLVESARIRLAFAWDPHFAVSLSGIEALPHQLEAVYSRMLPQPLLRFLLADDPGAGKTIMAGLLLKELRLRGAVERVLILAPAPLALQWQDELRSKFNEDFFLIDSHAVGEQLGGSPWNKHTMCVASMDFAKQEHITPDLLRERWDLVIVDEAHKASMPNLDKPTMRYRLMRQLVDRTERLLLLTATPHQGNPAQFQNLLGLLDPHAFRGMDNVHKLLQDQDSPWFLRRMKEDLRDFQGRKLFVKRHAHSQEFSLTEWEFHLYRLVTDYTNKFLTGHTGKRKQTAALARMVLQRRVASSLRAIRISLERRHKKLSDLVLELEPMTEEERRRHLYKLANKPRDDEVEDDDYTEEDIDDVALAVFDGRYEQLVDEVFALDELVDLAIATEHRGDESKLNKLKALLDSTEFREHFDDNLKLLIFTEQRATLDYLREKLTTWGYSTCTIHGGMNAVARKVAQHEFRRDKQVCLATDAAGEGINLQFCHLMINYDMPWNPMRLEQRMGRIHRFGQQREVHVYNFIATDGPNGEPVVEGRVLQTLLRKLDDIRDTIGDRVFDVIGLLLRENDVNLEDALREAAFNPGVLDDYIDQIEAISPEKLKEYEEATGIALAKQAVDLSRIHGDNFASEERRLMPAYVEEQFARMAGHTGLRIKPRANPRILKIEHVPQRFVAPNLVAVREHGRSARHYHKATFHKDELKKPEFGDAELLSPGHPLYAAADEIMRLALRDAVGGLARFLDPTAGRPYRLHLFDVTLEGESLGDPGEAPRARPVYARLVAVHEDEHGDLTLVQPDTLHDLTGVVDDAKWPSNVPWTALPDPAGLGRIEGWVRATVQFPEQKRIAAERKREVGIRRDYLTAAFDASIKEGRRKFMELAGRVMKGEDGAQLARNRAKTRLDELKTTRDHRMKVLQHMKVVRPSRVTRIGSCLVAPPTHPGAGMKRDDAVEQFAMDVALAYEIERGWKPDDISKKLDGSGFDIRSLGPTDAPGQRQVRRIEVKGRSADQGEVHLTPNEWKQARKLRDTYWLYVVWGCKTGKPVLKTICDPWQRLHAAANQIVEVKGYRVPDAALRAAQGKEFQR